MKPITAVLLMSGLVVLFVGGLAFQRCSYEQQLAQTAVKADKQVVDVTTQLATEHVEQAKAKATARRAAAAKAVSDEVLRDTSGDFDLVDWLAERTGGD